MPLHPASPTDDDACKRLLRPARLPAVVLAAQQRLAVAAEQADDLGIYLMRVEGGGWAGGGQEGRAWAALNAAAPVCRSNAHAACNLLAQPTSAPP